MCRTTIPAAGIIPVAFIDKLQVWLSRDVDDRQRRRIEATLGPCCGNGVHVDAQPMQYQPEWRCRIVLNQPDDDALRQLDKIVGGDPCLMNGLELALDLTSADELAVRDLRTFIDATLVQPKRKVATRPADRDERHPLYCNNGVYFGGREAPVNVVVYSDLVSKGNGLPCVHIDWRVKGVEQVRRLGVKQPADLLGFDHADFWQNNLRLYRLPTDPASLGQAFVAASPYYRDNELPCAVERIGEIVRRAAAPAYTRAEPGEEPTHRQRSGVGWTFEGATTAQSFVEWGRDAVWLDTLACMERLPSDALLPKNSVIRSETRPEPARHMQGGPRRKTLRECETRGLSDAAWQAVEPFIPAAVNRHRFGGGRARRNDRECMTAILLVAEGWSWGRIGKEGVCATKTAHDRFKEWRQAGVFGRMKDAGLDQHGELAGVDWSVLGVECSAGNSHDPERG